jgi:two-component system, NarL family, response regulator NreC
LILNIHFDKKKASADERFLMVPYRIILADHHAPLREGLKRILKEKPDLEIIGEAGDGSELLSLLWLSNLAPHMVILDPSMPSFWGVESIHKVKGIHPEVKILILGIHKDKEYFGQAIINGAEGYLLKENADRELLPAIELVRQGGVYVPSLLSGTLQN